MSRPQNKCVYCGAFGVTKEHIWGQWSRKTAYYQLIVLPLRPNFAHRVRRPLTENKEQLGSLEEGPGQRNGCPRSVSLKIACRQCNGGWMKEIAESAAPILKRTEVGQWWNMSTNERQAIAAWATMFFMSFEFLDHESIMVNAVDRKKFSDSSEPPKNWYVWIGRYTDTPLDVDVIKQARGIISDENTANEKMIPYSIQTFNFGKLLLHVICGHEQIEFDPVKYGKSINLCQIWPPTEIDMLASDRIITTQGKRSIAKCFHESLVQSLNKH